MARSSVRSRRPIPTRAMPQLLNDAGGRFALEGGRLIVKEGVKLDYEQAKSQQVVVRATDKHGLFLDQTFTIGVQDVAEEVVIGTSHNDAAVGGRGNDTFYGKLGRDTFTGGRGKTSSHSIRSPTEATWIRSRTSDLLTIQYLGQIGFLHYRPQGGSIEGCLLDRSEGARRIRQDHLQ
jgi:Ca2+-binding RTX toxin-like protein